MASEDLGKVEEVKPSHPIYGKMQPTNLLFQMEGNAAWQRDVLLYTPGEREIDGHLVRSLDKPKDYLDMMVTKPSNTTAKPGVDDLKDIKAKAKLPPYYCPGCGLHIRRDPDKPSGGAGFWFCIDGYPEVGLKPNDCIIYFKCDPCFQNNFPANAGRRHITLPNFGWKRYDGNRRMTTEANIIGYLKSARLNGWADVFIEEEGG